MLLKSMTNLLPGIILVTLVNPKQNWVIFID